MPIKSTGDKTLTVYQQNGTIEVRIPIRRIKPKASGGFILSLLSPSL